MNLYSAGNAILSVFKESLIKAANIGHRTFWIETKISNNIEASKVFVFCTVCEDSANNVKRILAENNLLCTTDLGSPSITKFKQGIGE